jgi:hypothetical protein
MTLLRPRCSTGGPVTASGTKVSGAYAKDPGLVPGLGFRLNEQGTWDVEQIPNDIVKEAEFSGYLTIHGYKSAVFETADKQMWAQKTTEAEEEVSEAETEFEKETDTEPKSETESKNKTSSLLRMAARLAQIS